MWAAHWKHFLLCLCPARPVGAALGRWTVVRTGADAEAVFDVVTASTFSYLTWMVCSAVVAVVAGDEGDDNDQTELHHNAAAGTSFFATPTL